ncbi:glycosyltransferase family 2 protein [Rothia endophytica]|uniref:glycosyltransferase family 2 protein n=1 Tax=Rothia endophytica TaxID=1324766 RepID=UPI001F20B48B|nr:glycosyltransferase family A protein [Rothia endophytica]
MSTYSAAVIIPTRGGASKLHYPLDALEQQTEKDFQVIVVIDGDIDASASVVQSYIERSTLSLSMIVFDENRGRVAALNAGHLAADAEVLIRCDDDLQPSPDYVAQHLSHHLAGEETGVIGIYQNILPDTPYARVYGRYRDAKFRQDAYLAPSDRQWMYWAGNVSMSRSLFHQLGGYDEAYRLYGWEDVDMGYRLYRAGAKIVIDPQLATPHHVAATTTAIRAKRALYSGAARNIFVRQHGENVLGSANPQGFWGLAVKTVAKFSTETNVKYWGNAIDTVADKLPPRLAEKLISLIVESASYAGVTHPQRAQKNF